MTVGIVGLGLIGGSFAKAYHEAGHRVLAFDTDQSVFDFAVLSGAVDGLLSEETLSSCDLILIAVYPSAAVDYLRQHGAAYRPEAGGHRLLRHKAAGLRRLLPAGEGIRLHLSGRASHGGHPQFRLQVCHAHHVPRRAHGAGPGGSQ